MPRIARGLTATAVARIKKIGRYADGNGLYLHVPSPDQKRWEWRGMVDGKRKLVAIGPISLYSLADARKIAVEWTRLASEGLDPKSHRDDQRAENQAGRAVPSFEAIARECHETTIIPAMRNGKHVNQWINTLRDYVFPSVGNRRINEINTADLAACLSPIWLEKPETARRIKQRVRKVFEYARNKPECRFEAVNPVDGLKESLPSQRMAASKKHHAALPYDDLPALMGDLQAVDTISSLALQFIILTATRSGETRKAQWSEIDLEEKIWTIPGERMKAGKPHRVPMCDAAIAILEQVEGLSGDFIFPSPRSNKALSDVAVAKVLARFHANGIATVHGMRSTFRDWCEEQTSFPHAVKERALAHTISNQAEAAYHRTDLLDKRRDLMDLWGRFAVETNIGIIIQLENRKVK